MRHRQSTDRRHIVPMAWPTDRPKKLISWSLFITRLVCVAVQRNCRRRRRSTRWSTTSSTRRSPNSPASRRSCICHVSVRPWSRPFCYTLLFTLHYTTLGFFTRTLHLLLSPTADETKDFCHYERKRCITIDVSWGLRNPSVYRISPWSIFFFTVRENFLSAFYFIIILWENWKSVVVSARSRLFWIKLFLFSALTSSRSFVRISCPAHAVLLYGRSTWERAGCRAQSVNSIDATSD